MSIDITIEDDRWEALGLSALCDRACAAALDHLGLDLDECEISLLACDDDRIAVLNADFRAKPVPTNVITLGDIAIAWETCEREAAEQGKRMEDHVTHLIVHGLLHLLGYDHVRDADATLMEGLETTILGELGLDDPYKDLDGP